jgi:S1-C subfamily serine protease
MPIAASSGSSPGIWAGADVDASVELVRHLTECVVNIQATVGRDHTSVPILGAERMGSGVVVEAGGLILTVNYVAMGAQTLQVSFLRGRRVRAEIVAQDFDIGLALLRIKRQGLTVAPLRGPGELERGEPVVAIASTGAQERRVTGGLVTYLGEFEAQWEYLLENGIISNAGNPGFGGGGLFTLKGQLAGIVSLNLNELIRNSLSIPVDHYREYEREFLRFGRVVSRPRRAWLGVFAHGIEEGIVVAGVVPGGPGDRGGLREGDLLVSLNAEKLDSRRDLYLSLWRHAPGDHLSFEVMRDSALRRVQVTGGDRAEFFRQP